MAFSLVVSFPPQRRIQHQRYRLLLYPRPSDRCVVRPVDDHHDAKSKNKNKKMMSQRVRRFMASVATAAPVTSSSNGTAEEMRLLVDETETSLTSSSLEWMEQQEQPGSITTSPFLHEPTGQHCDDTAARVDATAIPSIACLAMQAENSNKNNVFGIQGRRTAATAQHDAESNAFVKDIQNHLEVISTPETAVATTTTSTTNKNSKVSKQDQETTTRHTPLPPPVAIVLNRNARSVKEDVITMAKQVFQHHNGGANHHHNCVFVTGTVEEARAAAKAIVESGTPMVVLVGGDGTVSCMMNYLAQEYLQQHAAVMNDSHDNGQTSTTTDEKLEEAMRHLPVVGYIPLGTGNGVGSVVGCRPSQSSTTSTTTSKRNLLQRAFQAMWPAARRRRQLQDLQQTLERFQRVGQDLLEQQQQQQQKQPSTSQSLGATASTDYDLVDMVMIQVNHDSEALVQQQANAAGTKPFFHDHPVGDLCFFAGIGFDSLMLNDYKSLQAWSKRTGLFRRVLNSVTGYGVALVVKTLPQCLFRQAHQIRVSVSIPKEQIPSTLWVDHRRGDMVRRVNHGTTTTTTHTSAADAIATAATTTTPTRDDDLFVLYSGKAGILAAGTCPFYGGGLRLFPFARMTVDKMHLRLGRIHPLTGFVNIPRIFRGTYRDLSSHDFGCLDFIGTEFHVQVQADEAVASAAAAKQEEEESQQEGPKATKGETKPKSTKTQRGYPFQHSGESVGLVERFRLKAMSTPVKFVCFMKKRDMVG